MVDPVPEPRRGVGVSAMYLLTITQAAADLGVDPAKLQVLACADLVNLRTRDGRVVRGWEFDPDRHLVPEWAVAELAESLPTSRD